MKHFQESHAGVKCDICGIRTPSHKSLLYHKKHEHSNKPKCPSCSQFHKGGPLQHVCLECKEAFCLKKDLNRHRISNHGIDSVRRCKDVPREYCASNAMTESHECTYCTSVFDTNAELRKHLSTQHLFTPDLMIKSESLESPPEQQYRRAESSLFPGPSARGNYNWRGRAVNHSRGRGGNSATYENGHNYMMAPGWTERNERWGTDGWNDRGRGRMQSWGRGWSRRAAWW